MKILFFEEVNFGTKQKKKNVRRAKGPKVKRPLNGFFLYKDDVSKRKEIKELKLPQAQLNPLIAQMYKNEPMEVQFEYARRGELEAVLHKLQHPDYKFSPRNKTSVQREAMELETATRESISVSADVSTTEAQFERVSNEDVDKEAQQPYESTETSKLPSSILNEFQLHLDGSQLDPISLALAKSIDFIFLTETS